MHSDNVILQTGRSREDPEISPGLPFKPYTLRVEVLAKTTLKSEVL